MYFWISVGKTADAKSTQIANVIIGVLNVNKSYLISLKWL